MNDVVEQVKAIRSERREKTDARLAAAVEYVATRLAETADTSRGAVKLNKVVWWADQEFFRRVGYSITGSDYQRLPQGPVPYRLPHVRDSLVTDKRLKVTLRNVGARRPETILEPGENASSDAVRSVLSPPDIEMLDESLTKFFGWTGKRISDFSHSESVAWQQMEDGDLIPDAAWLIDPKAADISRIDVRQLLADNNLNF